jgi:hypothetical protein
MRNTSIVGWSVVLFAAPALAQSINIKFGLADAPVPDASYGAMGAAGYWNLIGGTEPNVLLDLNGAPTTVTNFVPPSYEPFTYDPPGPVGNDALLLNGLYSSLTGSGEELTITGLANGRYTVICYGINGLLGFVGFASEFGGGYLVGEWNGSLAPGIYVAWPYRVTNGTLSFEISYGWEGGAWSAMQFVQLSGPGCTADADGDGDPGTDADIEAFFACLAGTCCQRCSPADFDGDGDSGTDADLESFFRVLAGQAC